ncbi:MAG TPA: hypothetical protein VN833_10040 [Candidatus Acidoferrales bacterium]|jgi:hypothetical protein|nr:hypothetical protein [Candidatus Acidoferrales bacterium]
MNHHNLLAVFDMGTHPGAPYVVSKLREGETLRERLRSGAIAMRKTLVGVCAANFTWTRRRPRKLWRSFGAISAGVESVGAPHFSADGNAYAYIYQRVLPEAYGVTGRK